MDTASIRAFMARKVLGVPVMVFIFIGAAVILFFALRMRNTATDVPLEEPPTGDEGPGDFTEQPTFTALPDVASATPVVTTQATNDTNDLWKRRTIEWLMGNGYSVAVATNSISKYLSGDALNDAESKARDSAVKQFGLPPEDIPDVLHKSPNHTGRLSTPPASKQGQPPLGHEVKGRNDDTPSELGVLYYGTNSKDAVNKIQSANPTKVVPYAVGTKVRIPERYYPKYFKATGATHTLYDIARKNGVSAAAVEALNPGMKFPVKVGTRVRVK